jgi:hypothetical protein
MNIKMKNNKQSNLFVCFGFNGDEYARTFSRTMQRKECGGFDSVNAVASPTGPPPTMTATRRRSSSFVPTVVPLELLVDDEDDASRGGLLDPPPCTSDDGGDVGENP